MMRINLLGVPKTVAPTAVVEGEPAVASEAFIVGGVLFVALFLVTVIFYWSLSRDITSLTQDLQAQKTEQARLAGVRAQVAQYELQLNELKRQQTVIHDLQNSRTGPVELMQALGLTADKSNDLYLLSVNTSGDRLVLDGQANTPDSIANFMAALSQSGSFDDVQLRKSYEDDEGTRVNYKFNLDCIFKSSVQAPAAGTQGPAAAAPARRAGL